MFNIAIIIFIIIIIIYSYHNHILAQKFTIIETIEIVSNVDGLKYKVHTAHPNRQRAADILALLNKRIIDLMRFLKANHTSGYNAILVNNLLTRYNPDHLIENSPKDPTGDTAYSIDKGNIIAICLRERDPTQSGDLRNHDFHDLNLLTFVTIHEMTHVAIDVINHPKEFWDAFKFLLMECERAGIYTSTNYALSPQTYCGIYVDYNPRYNN